MRKVFTLLTVLLLSNTCLTSPAQAVQEIVISEPTHRLSDGVFFDDELSAKLAPTGELGLLIYSPSRGARIVVLVSPLKNIIRQTAKTIKAIRVEKTHLELNMQSELMR